VKKLVTAEVQTPLLHAKLSATEITEVVFTLRKSKNN